MAPPQPEHVPQPGPALLAAAAGGCLLAGA